MSEAAGKSLDSGKYHIPVVGGHSGVTIVPLLSQSNTSFSADQKDIEAITEHIQFGGDEVVKAKNNTGSATLSMAYAGAEFALAVLAAANGQTSDVPVYSYVDLAADASGAKAVTDVIGTSTPFFSVPLQLGKNGVEKVLPLGKLSEFESAAIKKAVEALNDNIAKGVSFKANKL